jgi:hypothetical protein
MDEFKRMLRQLLTVRKLTGRIRYSRQKMIISDLQMQALDINDEAEVKACEEAVQTTRDLMGSGAYMLRDLESYLNSSL